MTNPTGDAEGAFVRRLAGNVVLTMTPDRARVLATSIWLADRTQWLDVLAEDLSAAADRRGVFADQMGAPRAGELLSSVCEASDPQLGGRNAAGEPGRASTLPIENALVDALARAVAAETQIARGLEAAATHAALLAFEAVASAADRTALAAEAASDVRAVATARSAATIAETVRQAASAVLVAEEVSAAAVGIAQEVAQQATVVARAAATAAMEAAAAAADAAMALELTVRSAAVEVQTVAALTARRVAEETERAAVVALAAR